MQDRLTMPIGNAIFTQRSTRKLRPDPIPVEDLHLLMEAAVKAPNGGNNQAGRFLIVNDRAKILEFGTLYKEAWWAKRWDDHKWTKPEDIPLTDKNHARRWGCPRHEGRALCCIRVHGAGRRRQLGDPGLSEPHAGRARPRHRLAPDHAARQGDGSLPRDVRHPKEMTFHFCIPLGYPR